MLEQLFGSRTRTRLLHLFLKNPQEKFFIRELTRKIDTQINSVRRELKNLRECGIIDEVLDNSTASNNSVLIPPTKKTSRKKDSTLRKYFQANNTFLLFDELKELFLKSPLLLQNRFVREISLFGAIDYALMSGFFVGRSDTPVDLLIVGDVDRHKLARFISSLEKEIDQEINYALMKLSEYHYRKSITDRFLFTILEGKKIVLIDRLPVREKS
ncbi:hypothetical protein HY621_00545 [Candidatus Uhrbacteria bacterium]|nr:hypothetical protein [Candidatus Uhrbacteria bacterium]